MLNAWSCLIVSDKLEKCFKGTQGSPSQPSQFIVAAGGSCPCPKRIRDKTDPFCQAGTLRRATCMAKGGKESVVEGQISSWRAGGVGTAAMGSAPPSLLDFPPPPPRFTEATNKRRKGGAALHSSKQTLWLPHT